MLTNENLILDYSYPCVKGGVKKIYRFKNGYGLLVMNSTMLHAYPFAWEIAVLKDVSEDGTSFKMTYDTPLTYDFEVFFSEKETNDFIERASKELVALYPNIGG